MTIEPPDLLIELEPVTLPAFGRREGGYWANYDALEAAGISTITVTPVILRRGFEGDFYINVNCLYDTEVLPPDRFGIPYTDDQFEKAIDEHIHKVFGRPDLPRVMYTESGMQEDGLISMETGDEWAELFGASSAHGLLPLTVIPGIVRIDCGTVHWERPEPAAPERAPNALPKAQGPRKG